MLEWFTTIPGVLVICGVVLLILAVILFILGNKKGKVKEVKPATTDTPTESVSTETVSTVTEEPVAPVVEETPAVEENAQVIDFTPASEPVVETPAVEEPTPVEVAPVVEEAPAVEEPTPAVDNTIDFSIPEPTVEETPVTIYGGNSPLENTQVEMSTVEATPYGGAPEVNVVEPVAQPEAPTLEMPEVKVEEIQPEPTIEPTIPVAPTVEIPEPTVTTDNTNI